MTEVYGVPKPQGSKRAFVVKGRPVVTESAGQPLKDWRATVAQHCGERAAQLGWRPLDGPVGVRLLFRMPKPKSTPKWRRYPTTKPDIDKLTRAVLDAITGSLITDDARVAQLVVGEQFAERTGCVIEIRDLTAEERAGLDVFAAGALGGHRG